MDNVEEMDKFLETINLTRLNHKDTENLNRPIKKDITAVVKNLSNKGSGPDNFIGENEILLSADTILLRIDTNSSQMIL